MTAIPLHVLGLAMVVAFSAFLAKVLFPTRSGEIAPHFNGGVSGFLAQYTCTGCNPIGQIVFIMLFGGSFVVAYVTIFPLLHQNGMSELYRAIGLSLAALCLATFFLAGFSDPGIINESNVVAFMCLYPSDGILFPDPPATCQTCNRVKPARSKHCNATKACVAKYDHWCIWINNSVGFYNIRWFLAFIFSITVICAYVAFICCLVIWNDMDRLGAWDFLWIHPRSGHHVRVRDRWGVAARYVIVGYGPVAGLGLFCGLSGVIVLIFGGFQLHKFLKGETENERWKLNEKQQEEGRMSCPKLYRPFDQGWYKNIIEIAFPHSVLVSTHPLHPVQTQGDIKHLKKD